MYDEYEILIRVDLCRYIYFIILKILDVYMDYCSCIFRG